MAGLIEKTSLFTVERDERVDLRFAGPSGIKNNISFL